MKTNPCSNFSTELDPHTPYPFAGRPARLTPRSDLTDRSWPFLGSIALHALLFAILFHSGFQYPILISSKTAAIYWFSMIDLQDIGAGEEVSLNGPTVASAGQQLASEREYDRQQPGDDDDPVRTDVPDPPTATTASAAEPELTVATPQPAQYTARTGNSLKPQTGTPRHNTPAPIPPQVKKVSVPLEQVPESPRALPAKQPAMTKPAESRSPGNDNLLKKEADHVSPQIIEQQQQAAEKKRREQVVREQELRAIQDRLELERAAGEKTERKLMTKPLPLNKPAGNQPKKESETQIPVQPADKPVSISLPQIRGDLKLIIAGQKPPVATIAFKDFALARRDRPFSRAESRRSSKIVPLIANREDTSREIVITRASPGVYIITLEPADDASDVALSVKLYEGSSGAITRNLGKVALARKRFVLKVLMPEGIFWDDNSAFTGNMEDSDGVTKFNAETGLMWKEYDD